jgi:hypothetical protein
LDTEWLLSLCLTPPCYQLQKPPETAALFFAIRHFGPDRAAMCRR